MCAPKIRQKRAEEIQAGLAVHQALGGGIEFATFTIRHGYGDDLAQLLQLVADGFRSILMGDPWRNDREAFGIVGTIRTLELTHGANGWHPHLHVLVLTAAPLDDTERQLLTDRLWIRWARYIGRTRPASMPEREHGLVLVEVVTAGDVARYMSKVYDTLHHEMTRGDLKSSRNGRNPFRILGDAVEHGDRSDLNLWLDYERALHGRQFLTWSKGLKDRLGVNDATDEDLAAEEVGGEVIAKLGAIHWTAVRRRPILQAQLLDAAEQGGERAVYELLEAIPIDA